MKPHMAWAGIYDGRSHTIRDVKLAIRAVRTVDPNSALARLAEIKLYVVEASLA